ncbi:MAG: hypothetical protein AAFX85_11780 [Pseudomonadota bacterium]
MSIDMVSGAAHDAVGVQAGRRSLGEASLLAFTFVRSLSLLRFHNVAPER